MIDLDVIEGEARRKIEEASTIDAVEAVRLMYIGRKGAVTEALRALSSLPLDERKRMGEKLNALKELLERSIDARKAQLQQAAFDREIAAQQVEIARHCAFPFPRGSTHPLRKTMADICAIFSSLGFSIAQGPEIETDWYNFEALNIPKDHPARDAQDTFYLAGDSRLLRTHTSPGQIHVMERQAPPVRVIIPGRVYRNEATDASHSAIFHQVEGLAVDTDITFADLKGILALFVQRMFGSDTSIRFRPSYFQFTEPSAEVDMRCFICSGKGCKVCKGSGWLEMLGCGMVHPNVFKAVQYDPDKYTGFAFGIGVERFALLQYGVDDIRIFYENNLQFLSQF